MSAARILILIVPILGVSCANLTPRQKVFRDMSLAGLTGVLIGQTRKEYKNENSALMAGVLASGVGVTSLILRQNEIDSPREEVLILKTKLKKFESGLEPELISQGKSLFSTPLPRELHPFVEPGEWRRYKMDQWVQDPNQPNQWFRQIEMIEILPPLTK